MKSFFSINLFFLSALLWGGFTFAAPAEQCFYKHEGIDKIPGSTLLPKKVCFAKLEILQGENSMSVRIDGDPIVGLFDLEIIKEYETYIKYMTYIFSQEHQGETGKVNVTLRLSSDVIKNTNAIDYVYLAAEFFVPNDDGSFDTHIYYYKRNSTK